MISKLLIANRGEIAIRIAKTARRMGIQTVSVFSDADEEAPHRFAADESYHIGASPSLQSYLDQERILEVMTESKCDAVHPGYGFLSENPLFAEAVEGIGRCFIGPTAATIRLMGDKLAAKELAQQCQIPLVPGTEEPLSEIPEARKFATEVGFPVLLKAAGGGGGKGMRVILRDSDFDDHFQAARNEAVQSFDDSRIFVEKYVETPKHIEIQVFGDGNGNVVHLFERDCSVQRRYQKVIEESPAPSLSAGLREKITNAAVSIAKACTYRGAGTVEFLVDHQENFYFLEMNTRLQVEHPVTESVTGIDLVQWQIEVANGLGLPLSQEDISTAGHAIELRVYAEDILDDFKPAVGTVAHYQEPEGAGIRLDSGITQGYRIPVYYDPMLAKLIVWAPSRSECIHRLKKALNNFIISGVSTTLPVGRFILDHPHFVNGTYTTHYLSKNFSVDSYIRWNKSRAEAAAILAASLRSKEGRKITGSSNSLGWWTSRKDNRDR